MYYSQGTVSTVSGSAIVRGTDTKFKSNINGVAPGQVILIQSSAGNFIHMIQAVNSDTELVLADNATATLNNVTYQIQTTVPDSVSDGVRHIVANTSYITQFLQNMDKWMSQSGVVDVTLPNGQTVALQSIRALQAAMLDKNKNGADIPNKNEFVKNLGLAGTAELAKNAVPASRKINGKPLTGDITLNAGDVKAYPIPAYSDGMPSDNYIGPFLGGSRAGWAKGISIGASGGDVGQIWIDSGATLHTRFLNRGSGAQQQRIWSTGNTIIVDGGYLKKASPIIKIWSTGEFETNDESAGATVERLSEGVYLIKNVLGFNADAAWGGVDGGIEIPLCKNKLPLIWVDYRVLPDGSIKLMTYHREHAGAPAFARNAREGYADGDPIDIPSGRFVSVRVQMPATEEDATPQDFPVPVENVASDPR